MEVRLTSTGSFWYNGDTQAHILRAGLPRFSIGYKSDMFITLCETSIKLSS